MRLTLTTNSPFNWFQLDDNRVCGVTTAITQVLEALSDGLGRTTGHQSVERSRRQKASPLGQLWIPNMLWSSLHYMK